MAVAIAFHADWVGLAESMRLGWLHAGRGAGREVFEFEFDAAVLAHPATRNLHLDPRLGLFEGRQHPPQGLETFGVFADASPDGWGRSLMRRRLERAQRAGRVSKALRLHESDYPLGVHDVYRSGALRLRRDDAGDFLDNQHGAAAPRFVQLRKLEAASLALERDEDNTSAAGDDWLRMLIAPGGRLGVRARKFASRQHTFLVRRFDRTPAGRLHFASAMSLTSRQDGDDAATGASYLEIARVLIDHGANTAADLRELWSRIVFNMLVSNTDDHLRNHGFLLVPGKGWRLSGAYDMNPVSGSQGLKLNVSEADNAMDVELARSVAPYFRVSRKLADEIVTRSQAVVKQWPRIADSLKIRARERERMAAAFRLAG